MNNTVEKMTFLDFPRQSSYSIQVRWANIQAVDVTNKQTNRHYENNGHLAVNHKKPSYRWGTARRGRASWNLV